MTKISARKFELYVIIPGEFRAISGAWQLLPLYLQPKGWPPRPPPLLRSPSRQQLNLVHRRSKDLEMAKAICSSAVLGRPSPTGAMAAIRVANHDSLTPLSDFSGIYGLRATIKSKRIVSLRKSYVFSKEQFIHIRPLLSAQTFISHMGQTFSNKSSVFLVTHSSIRYLTFLWLFHSHVFSFPPSSSFFGRSLLYLEFGPTEPRLRDCSYGALAGTLHSYFEHSSS